MPYLINSSAFSREISSSVYFRMLRRVSIPFKISIAQNIFLKKHKVRVFFSIFVKKFEELI